MVVVVDQPNTPPLQWPLGVIEQVIPGSDGEVRVITVHNLARKVKRQPVSKNLSIPRFRPTLNLTKTPNKGFKGQVVEIGINSTDPAQEIWTEDGAMAMLEQELQSIASTASPDLFDDDDDSISLYISEDAFNHHHQLGQPIPSSSSSSSTDLLPATSFVPPSP
ncbi:uncharacterized protein LOC120352014 [Nilaparvata lugens]|uniref:uncharacterized protein LOC120352014 n=1 Tax=Nilaparvata lugens TaxID=108931 RepID=UPI00193C877C|nr:uncharacterized protein LOC120352014 [Nilaparvata lugens]